MRQVSEPDSTRVFAHRTKLRGTVVGALPVLAESAPDYAPGWSTFFRIHLVFPLRMPKYAALLIRVSVVRAHPGELKSEFELWYPKELTPGVERSTAGRFSFLPTFSKAFATFRVPLHQAGAFSVLGEISVYRTQPSRFRPHLREIGYELSDSLFLDPPRINTEVAFEAWT